MKKPTYHPIPEAPNVTSVSRNATAFCRPHRSHLELCVPVEPDATTAWSWRQITKWSRKIRTSACPGGDAGREIHPRCHHDRISDFRTAKIPLNHGAGDMPVLRFGTLIPDAATTISATRDA